jgi:TRAP-type C4-dicarboxylate transport system substrate-binding protein
VKAFVVLIFLIVLIGVVILVIRKRKFSELPPEIQTGIERAQDTRAKYHRVLRVHNHSMSAAQHDLGDS